MGTTAPTYAQFVAALPSFAPLDQSVVEYALDLSARLLDEAAWGTFFSDAVSLDAAHNLTMAGVIGTGVTGGVQGTSGPIQSVSGAGLSTSFASIDFKFRDMWYSKTAYGQQFLRLRQVVIPSGVLAC
jgi:hypothetical protein